MKTRFLIVIRFSILVIIGISLNFYFYHTVVAPIDSSIGNLNDIVNTSDHESIQLHLTTLKLNLHMIIKTLPENKNPVWLYPTSSTDFLRIDSDVDAMISSIDKISVIPKETTAYNTGMLDINSRAMHLEENLLDARNFMYASVTNMVFTLIWISGAVGIARTWMRSEN